MCLLFANFKRQQGSTSNMIRHMKRKHPGTQINRRQQSSINNSTIITGSFNQQSTSENALNPPTEKKSLR